MVQYATRLGLGAGRGAPRTSVIDYERYVQYVAGELGIEIQRRIPVYALNGVSGYCNAGSAACATRDGVVFAIPGTAFISRAATRSPSMIRSAHAMACKVAILSGRL